MSERNNTSRKWRIAAIALLIAAVATTAWWMRGEKFWSDGGRTRIADNDARLREVLWTPPQPFGHELDAPDQQQYEPSVSPDGGELYFVRGKPGAGARIYMSHRSNGAWAKPQAVDAVNGNFDSLGPRLTADGKFLLFYSNRPGGLGGYDIWAAPRAGAGWGKPFNLGPSVNSEFNEYNPDPTPDGKRLIFSTNRKSASREQVQAWQGTIRQSASADYDLWIATLDDAAPQAATQPSTQPATRPASPRLAFKDAAEIPGINSPFTEGASCMSPAGDFLYFASNRPGGFGKFDIYRSRVRGDAFDPPEDLGPTINSSDNETDPSLALDGFRLCFSSDRASLDGRYSLFSSDSREVFAEHQARAFPRIGWNILSLLASTLILIPLIFLLRGTQNRRLSLLQRCLVLSLLIHALAAFLFSFVRVTQQVVRYAGQGGTGVNLNLHAPADAQVGNAIRGQFSAGNLAAQTAPQLASLERTAMQTPDAPQTIALTIPASQHDTASAPLNISPPLAVSRPQAATPENPDAIEPKMLSILASAPTGIGPASPNRLRQDDAPPKIAPAASSLGKTQSVVGTVNPFFELHTPAPPAHAASGASGITDAPAITTTARTASASIRPGLNIEPQVPSRPELPLASVVGARRGPISITPQEATGGGGAAIDPIAPATRPVSGIAGAATGENDIPGTLPAAKPSAVAPATMPISLAASRMAAGGVQATIASPPPALTDITFPHPKIDVVLNPGPTMPRRSSQPEVLPAKGDQEVKLASGRLAATPSTAAPALIQLSTPPANQPSDAGTGDDSLQPLASSRGPSPTTNPIIDPTLSFSPLAGALGPGAVIAPPSPFPRAPEQRRTRVEKLGGTDESERAVDRGLVWLAAAQEADGRWSHVFDEAPTGRDAPAIHDTACTALSLLAFLARDHAPQKDGPYRPLVNKAIDYLLSIQDDDGDLRGPAEQRGGGPSRANMYDHAIATLALAEAAVMSHDRRCTAAAIKGAQFIVRAQDPNSGGWRYAPGDFGDSSVFGWQIMALHAAEQLGFRIPDDTRAAALRYTRSCAQGQRGMLAGYQPGHGPTAAMTAEILYARMLLGQQSDPDDIQEAASFLSRQRFDPRTPDLYCWYYGSLCLIQAQNETWKQWNTHTRDSLIALQHKGGRLSGSWDTSARWGDQGGRVFTTSLAVLRLEVYYRYLPVLPQPIGVQEQR